jgi:hypothetical protein
MTSGQLDDVGPSRSRAIRFDQSGLTTQSLLQITEVQLTAGNSASENGRVLG